MRIKNVSGVDVRCEWLPAGYADPGEEIDVPDKQPDGSPLIWHPDIWEDVTPKKTAAKKTDGDVT